MDKFPYGLSPMLATLSQMPKNLAAYAFEFKWDGYRALLFYDGKKTELVSRNAMSFSGRFPEILAIQKKLKKPVVLDGEVVALNDKGTPDFGLLQRRVKGEKAPLQYMIFDVLYEGGKNTMKRPYLERREKLLRLKLDSPVWKTPPHQVAEGPAMLEVAKKHGFEGIMAKKVDSLYEAGRRSAAWLKVRLWKRQEMVIGGWAPGEGSLQNGLGSLLLGFYEPDGRLRYAGLVGTGFNEKERTAILKTLQKIKRDKSPFYNKVERRHAVWAEPRLVAEIQFTEWTLDKKMRHPSFVGFRLDKKPREVVLETPLLPA